MQLSSNMLSHAKYQTVFEIRQWGGGGLATSAGGLAISIGKSAVWGLQVCCREVALGKLYWKEHGNLSKMGIIHCSANPGLNSLVRAMLGYFL